MMVDNKIKTAGALGLLLLLGVGLVRIVRVAQASAIGPNDEIDPIGDIPPPPGIEDPITEPIIEEPLPEPIIEPEPEPVMPPMEPEPEPEPIPEPPPILNPPLLEDPPAFGPEPSSSDAIISQLVSRTTPAPDQRTITYSLQNSDPFAVEFVNIFRVRAPSGLITTNVETPISLAEGESITLSMTFTFVEGFKSGDIYQWFIINQVSSQDQTPTSETISGRYLKI